jgi:hypothetical protein
MAAVSEKYGRAVANQQQGHAREEGSAEVFRVADVGDGVVAGLNTRRGNPSNDTGRFTVCT